MKPNQAHKGTSFSSYSINSLVRNGEEKHELIDMKEEEKLVVNFYTRQLERKEKHYNDQNSRQHTNVH